MTTEDDSLIYCGIPNLGPRLFIIIIPVVHIIYIDCEILMAQDDARMYSRHQTPEI